MALSSGTERTMAGKVEKSTQGGFAEGAVRAGLPTRSRWRDCDQSGRSPDRAEYLLPDQKRLQPSRTVEIGRSGVGGE